MKTPFGKLIQLIYVRGYFEKGYVNNTEYKAQPFFVLNLLRGSVKYPALISLSEAAINGYIKGDSIDVLVQMLKNAEFDTDSCSEYLKSLYATNHKDTKTFRQRYNGKTYKEALFEKVAATLKDTSQDSMSMDLALLFKNIIDTISPQGKSQTQDTLKKRTVSTDKTDSTIEGDDSLETKIEKQFNKLIKTGREIAEFKPTGVGDDIRHKRLMGTLNDDFEQLQTLSDLLPHNLIDDNSSIPNDIRCSIQSLTAENFILSTSQFMIESLRNYHIHRISELLKKAKEKS